MNKSFYNDPNNHTAPVPLYLVDQVVMWEYLGDRGELISGGMGRVVGARYCVNERLGKFWQYSIQAGYGDSKLDVVNEDKIVNSIPL